MSGNVCVRVHLGRTISQSQEPDFEPGNMTYPSSTSWLLEGGHLIIVDHGRHIAAFAPGEWSRVELVENPAENPEG